MAELKTIIHNFSRNACHYDNYADVQRHAADCLVELLINLKPFKIADLGCGTGILTEKLARIFPDVPVDAIDISKQMIEVARQKLDFDQISFLVSDIKDLSPPRNYELIVSNACFQWLSDMPGILKKCHNMILPGGTLAFSVFGSRTYQELQECITKVCGRDSSISATSFADPNCVKGELKHLFGNTTMFSHVFERSYASLLDLLLAIKYTGTRGAGLDDFSFTKKTLRDMESCYIETFGSIKATFQLACFKASKESL